MSKARLSNVLLLFSFKCFKNKCSLSPILSLWVLFMINVVKNKGGLSPIFLFLIFTVNSHDRIVMQKFVKLH